MDTHRPAGDGPPDDGVEHISPHLSRRETKEVERRIAPDAAVIHEVIRAEGEEHIQKPIGALAWSALAAGLSMGFSLVAEGLIHANLPEATWTPLVSNFGYTFGFLIVILGRQQLFTENTVTAVLPLLHAPSVRRFRLVARLWGVVLAMNLVGTLLFAAALATTDSFPPKAAEAFTSLGVHAVGASFGSTFFKAVFAGWLIALMVWLLPSAGSARVIIIILVTYVVALGELSHIIAGSAEVAYAAIVGAVTWRDYLVLFLIPTLLGNSVGGVVLVSALNHAQAEQKLKGEC